jgi:hypothetical protein
MKSAFPSPWIVSVAAAFSVLILVCGPAGASVQLSEDFNANNGGFTVTNVNDPFEGPWVYNAARHMVDRRPGT